MNLSTKNPIQLKLNKLLIGSFYILKKKELDLIVCAFKKKNREPHNHIVFSKQDICLKIQMKN